MKNKKKQYIIAGAATAAILLAVILCVALISGKSQQTPTKTEPDTNNMVSVSDISIEEPEKTDETTSDINDDAEGANGDVTAEEIPDGANVLTPEEKVESENSPEEVGEKPDTAEQPATPSPLPEENVNNGGGEVIIDGGYQNEPYSCGVEGHHCNAPETHAFILNLELEGCSFCGSHNCPSFYGTDEWGNGGLFPKLCPKYDIKKDPAYYCQSCGKKCWDGTNGTCVQFVNSDNCPNCGEWVEAWTCHTCK